jgi:hypothetical protein
MHRPERVGAQRHRTEDLAGPDVDLHAAPRACAVVELELDAGTARTGQRDVRGTAPRGEARGLERGTGREHLAPARAAQLGRHRWAGDTDLVDLDAGAARAPGRQRLGRTPPCDRRAPPCRRRSAGHRQPLGPRRTTSSAATGRGLAPVSSASAWSGRAPGGASTTHHRWPAATGGLSGPPAGVRLDVGRLDPGRLQREARARGRGPGATGAQYIATGPSAPGPGGAQGGERCIRRAGPARRSAVSSAKPPRDHVGPRRLEKPLELGPPQPLRTPWIAGERARRAVDAQHAAAPRWTPAVRQHK